MNILITGAAGMVGRKLTAHLLAERALNDKPIERLKLLDVTQPARPDEFSTHVEAVGADITDLGTARAAIAGLPDVIFHLAAVVSGEAELDFEKGIRVNFDGARALLEAIRTVGGGYCPRFVFSSSIAVFGAPFPDSIPDDFALTPLTSYGTQKAMVELMLADYTRRGFVDGVGIRLPNVVVRPGKPNKAASGFFSSIIREPLNGRKRCCRSTRAFATGTPARARPLVFWSMRPDLTVRRWRRASTSPCPAFRAPSASRSRRCAGSPASKVAARIRHAPDPLVQRIVAGWPGRFDTRRAAELGFKAETSFDAIIRAHIDDELGGKIAA